MGKKFARPTVDVDESSSDDYEGKPAAKETPQRRTSPHCQTRNNGKHNGKQLLVIVFLSDGKHSL